MTIELSGEGFLPGEEVYLAVVRRVVSAGIGGTVRVLLDLRELDSAAQLVLLGVQSGTISLEPARS